MLKWLQSLSSTLACRVQTLQYGTLLLTRSAGIAWLAVEGNPLLFELIGLGMGT